MTSKGNTFPIPPFPSPDNPRFELLKCEAGAQMERGEHADGVIVWALVHGWLEGYIDAAGEQLRPSGPLSDETAAAMLEKIRAEGISGV